MSKLQVNDFLKLTFKDIGRPEFIMCFKRVIDSYMSIEHNELNNKRFITAFRHFVCQETNYINGSVSDYKLVNEINSLKCKLEMIKSIL